MNRRLDDDLIKEFCEHIEDGLPIMYCCDLCSILNQSFNNWMRQGLTDIEVEKDTVHARLFTAVKKSYARFIKASKKKIYNGDPGWQGAAWWLERTNKNFIANSDDGSQVEPVIVKATMNKNS